ncbi:MAG: hypothetical protein ACYDH9_02815 [Limisphaerales bacterium]
MTKISELSPPTTNNDFTNRYALTGTHFTVLGSNISANKEPGEPDHAGNPGGKSVWWTWTAPANGTVTISTRESNFDTLLAVYTNSTLASLGAVMSNDDETDSSLQTSRVTFKVLAGITCQIAVDGKDGAAGSIALSLTLSVPPNDDFAQGAILNGLPTTVAGSNVDATGEPDESSWGKSVWWVWTAATNGSVTVTVVGEGFTPWLRIYNGSTISTLSLVADYSIDSSQSSRITFRAVAGTSYHISVDGPYGASGPFTVALAPAHSPLNDDFANRKVLTGSQISSVISNQDATQEPGEDTLETALS